MEPHLRLPERFDRGGPAAGLSIARGVATQLHASSSRHLPANSYDGSCGRAASPHGWHTTRTKKPPLIAQTAVLISSAHPQQQEKRSVLRPRLLYLQAAERQSNGAICLTPADRGRRTRQIGCVLQKFDRSCYTDMRSRLLPVVLRLCPSAGSGSLHSPRACGPAVVI